MVDLDCFYENSARYKRTFGVIALTAVLEIGLERTRFGGRPGPVTVGPIETGRLLNFSGCGC